MEYKSLLLVAALHGALLTSGYGQGIVETDTLVKGNIQMINNRTYRFDYVTTDEGRIDSLVYVSAVAPAKSIEYSIIRKIEQILIERFGKEPQHLQITNVSYGNNSHSLTRDNVGLVYVESDALTAGTFCYAKALIGPEEVFMHFDQDPAAATEMLDKFLTRYSHMFTRGQWKRLETDFRKGQECPGGKVK